MKISTIYLLVTLTCIELIDAKPKRMSKALSRMLRELRQPRTMQCGEGECQCTRDSWKTTFCCSCLEVLDPNSPILLCPDDECYTNCPGTDTEGCCFCGPDDPHRTTVPVIYTGPPITFPTPTTTTTTTPARSGGGSSCFPSKSNVKLENGKSVRMSQLRTGDKVQTVSSSGQMIYSTVTSFMKKRSSEAAMYTSISTTHNKTITLSGNHLIYARNSWSDKFNPVYADQILVGDEVLVQDNDELSPARVVITSSKPMQGVFSPVTMAGNIVVDGVLASCYPSADHDLLHFGMTPLRWFPETTKWLLGEDDGLQAYVKIAAHVAQLVTPFGFVYKEGHFSGVMN